MVCIDELMFVNFMLHNVPNALKNGKEEAENY